MNPSSQITLDHELLNFATQIIDLIFREILHAHVGRNPCFLDDFSRTSRTDPVYIRQRDFDSLVVRQIDTRYSRH
jgi:hypothetical protein